MTTMQLAQVEPVEAPAPGTLAVPMIVGAGSATPPGYAQRELWEKWGRDYFHAQPLAETAWSSSKIDRRHFAADPYDVAARHASTGTRMQRYAELSLPLGRAAATEALAAAGVAPQDIGLFAVVSCTGYATPGLDILLARELGMDPGVRRVVVGHMGCHAAIPGLGAVSEYAAVRHRPALLLCLELCSLHMQPPLASGEDEQATEASFDQATAHALFGDAASAIVIQPETNEPGTFGAGLEVVDIFSTTDADSTGHMSWTITDHGFRMRLSRRVPSVLRKHVRNAATELLATRGLTLADVDGYAIHPGGPQILRVVGDALELSDDDLQPSYDILREYGNCSSATVLLVLNRLLKTRPLRPGSHVLAMAFGPGLTLFSALLRTPTRSD